MPPTNIDRVTIDANGRIVLTSPLAGPPPQQQRQQQQQQPLHRHVSRPTGPPVPSQGATSRPEQLRLLEAGSQTLVSQGDAVAREYKASATTPDAQQIPLSSQSPSAAIMAQAGGVQNSSITEIGLKNKPLDCAIPSDEADKSEGVQLTTGAKGDLEAFYNNMDGIERLNMDRVRIWSETINPEHVIVDLGEHNCANRYELSRKDWIMQSKYSKYEFDVHNCEAESCKFGRGRHFAKILQGEIAHLSWVPDEIDGIPTHSWWADHIMQHRAITYTEDEPEPFWQRFSPDSPYTVRPLVFPEANLDPSDSKISIALIQTTEKAVYDHPVNKKRRAEYDKREESYINRQRDKIREAWKAVGEHSLPANPHTARVDMYIRPIAPQDVKQAKAILNHFIKETVFTNEILPYSLELMQSHVDDLEEEKLPFLVAVLRTASIGQIKGSTLPASNNETVVGYGFAEDYNGRHGIYRFTVALQVYVAPAYASLGIGRCLLDKLLHLLDGNYISRGGYEFKGEMDVYGRGGRRNVGSIFIDITYASQDPERVAFFEKWLQQFHFKKVADFPEVGFKFGQMINQAKFLRKTDTNIPRMENRIKCTMGDRTLT